MCVCAFFACVHKTATDCALLCNGFTWGVRESTQQQKKILLKTIISLLCCVCVCVLFPTFGAPSSQSSYLRSPITQRKIPAHSIYTHTNLFTCLTVFPMRSLGALPALFSRVCPCERGKQWVVCVSGRQHKNEVYLAAFVCSHILFILHVN